MSSVAFGTEMSYRFFVYSAGQSVDYCNCVHSPLHSGKLRGFRWTYSKLQTASLFSLVSLETKVLYIFTQDFAGKAHCQDPCIKINECPAGSSQCTTQCKGVTRRRRDEESHNTMSFLQVTAFLFMVRILLLHFCPYCNIMSVHCKNPTGSLIINMYWNWQKKGRRYL